MSNSNSTAHSTPLADFEDGDIVLCPLVGDLVYELFHDAENEHLAFIADGEIYYYRADGKASPDDILPSIFHDTMENSGAIYQLYGEPSTFKNCHMTTRRPIQTSQPIKRKVIDVTAPDDDEIIIMPSMMLADAACDIDGAIQILNDVGALLSLIYRKEITHSQAISMARLSHDATVTWADLLCSQLNAISEPLAQTRFCEGVTYAS